VRQIETIGTKSSEQRRNAASYDSFGNQLSGDGRE
jgi:hypothetical protein